METKVFTQDNLSIDEVSSFFYKGEVVAFPTETVYGLGTIIEKREKLYFLKKRDFSKPLTLHISRLEDVEKFSDEIPKEFYILANYFFPGPLTIIIKKKKNVLINDKDTIGIRMPAHGLTLNILNALKNPILATSANMSNDKDLIDAIEVYNTFKNKIKAVIDGGVCPIGIPSTVISLVGTVKILREGFISQNQIENILKKNI